MRRHAILIVAGILAACAGPSGGARPGPERTAAVKLPPQVPPVELGHRPPNTHITSQNMPFFDRVVYCEWATRGHDTMPKGPAYEMCVENQAHYLGVMAQAIDARTFSDAAIVRCAKETRSAYKGMWYCLNGQDFLGER